MTCSKTLHSLLELFFFNFSQGSYNQIINQKNILNNKFMKRKLCQIFQFVIRSDLKKRSKSVTCLLTLVLQKAVLEIECKSQ